MLPRALTPRFSWLGQMLPASWQEAVRARARGLGPAALAADLLLSYPRDDLGLDPVLAKRTFFFLDQTVCRYFRLQVIGADRIPAGRALVVGCHSGVLPWDATCLVVAIYRHTGRFSRNAAHQFFGRSRAVKRFLATQGVLIAEAPRLEELLRRDEIVLLFPGGADDMRRRFWERYRVKPHKGFAPKHGGYIKIAVRTRSPIVPVAIVGAEETHFLVGEVPPLARLTGLPYAPIVLSLVPLPARFYIRFGDPIRLDAPPSAAADQAVVDRLNVEVQARLQALIDDTVRRRRGIYCSTYDGDTR